jgi:4,5-dihydroxyphthalate decarboxylase
MGRGQLHTIFYNPLRGALSPRDLTAKRVGVRSYTQTTGAWVRGILGDEFGVDSNNVTWVTFEDPHLAEYKDPPCVVRATQGKTLEQMLLGGEIDAAILPNVPQPPLAPLFPDAAEVDRKWAEKNGGVPINHMLVIRSGIAKERPDIVREVYRLLLESKNAALVGKPAPALDPIRFGVEENRRTLEIVIDYSFRQKLIPRKFTVGELFDETRAALALP